MPPRESFWKPCCVTVNSYSPMGSSGKEKRPSAFVVASLVRPVRRLRLTTCAPGTAAPFASSTVPVSRALFVCALKPRAVERISVNAKMSEKSFCMFLLGSKPPCGGGC
jgi:hypothetical protein